MNRNMNKLFICTLGLFSITSLMIGLYYLPQTILKIQPYLAYISQMLSDIYNTCEKNEPGSFIKFITIGYLLFTANSVIDFLLIYSHKKYRIVSAFVPLLFMFVNVAIMQKLYAFNI